MKKGTFYILESSSYFKYGVTRKRLKQRIRHAKWKFKEDFNCIFTKKVSGIFDFETRFKWRIWGEHLGIDELLLKSEDCSRERLICLGSELDG